MKNPRGLYEKASQGLPWGEEFKSTAIMIEQKNSGCA